LGGLRQVSERGFSLIETLVALVVMSVGLLGVAALHVDSMQRGQSGLFATRAVLLAGDMADRIRANALAGENYAIDWQQQPPAGDECADSADGPAPGWPTGCDALQMAQYDVRTWKESLAPTSPLGLPSGDGRILVNTATIPTTYIIQVQWRGRQETNIYTLSVQDDPSS